MMRHRRTVQGRFGYFSGTSARPYRSVATDVPDTVRVVKAGKRNTCLVYNEKIFVKLYKRICEGPHPEIELQRTLSEDGEGTVPRYLGDLTYRGAEGTIYAIGIATDYFHHSRTLWHMAMDAASHYLEATLASDGERLRVDAFGDEDAGLPEGESQAALTGLLIRSRVDLAGRLTGRMHLRLSEGKDESFRVEPFTMLYQRSLYQTFRIQVHRCFSTIEAGIGALPEESRRPLVPLATRRREVLEQFQGILRSKISAVRMRIHGDYHLGQIMIMDERYRICDFEGTPNAPLSERRIKRSPLRDIATMIYSFHSVSLEALYNNLHIQESDRRNLFPGARLWAERMEKVFLSSYLKEMEGSGLVSPSCEQNIALLRLYLLIRSMSELEYAVETAHERIPIAAQNFAYFLDKLTMDKRRSAAGNPQAA